MSESNLTGSGSERLKPCPFCGGEALLERDGDHHGDWFNLGCAKAWGLVADSQFVCIAGRLVYTAPLDEMPDAIAAWNRRTKEGE